MQDKAQLRIGRQLLDGSLVALKKPQAVLSKVRARAHARRRAPRRRRALDDPPTRGSRSFRAVCAQEPAVEGEPIQYTVIGVIRRKVQFTTRPNPIIPLAGDAAGGSGPTT